jgi:hypothetical protein
VHTIVLSTYQPICGGGLPCAIYNPGLNVGPSGSSDQYIWLAGDLASVCLLTTCHRLSDHTVSNQACHCSAVCTSLGTTWTSGHGAVHAASAVPVLRTVASRRKAAAPTVAGPVTLFHVEVQVNRTKTPWLVVIFHNPWYTTWGGFKTEDCTRQAMEPLFKQYEVDLVYNGARKVLIIGQG